MLNYEILVFKRIKHAGELEMIKSTIVLYS